MRALPSLALAALVCGCWAKFEETHFFQQPGPFGQAANYYRLEVSGGTWFSSSRYIAGYYDERAVDLFFNQLKPAGQNGGGISPLFVADQKEPGSAETITPLTPTSGRGAFVMLFSSDANAVANAIGQFSESQVVAEAVTNLVNRPIIQSSREASAMAQAESMRSASLVMELDGLFQALSETDTAEQAAVRHRALDILRALARASGDMSSFSDFDDAERWLSGLRTGGR